GRARRRGGFWEEPRARNPCPPGAGRTGGRGKRLLLANAPIETARRRCPPRRAAAPHRFVRAIRRGFPSTLDRERRGQCQSVRDGPQERLAKLRTEPPPSTPRRRLRERHKRARPAA